jgi:hypothetical protein
VSASFDFFVSFCSFALNSIFLCDWHYHVDGKRCYAISGDGSFELLLMIIGLGFGV